MRRVITLLLAVTIGALAPATSALAAAPSPASGAGSVGIRLVAVPGSQPNPLGSSYIVDRLAPGAKLDRSVEIANFTRSTIDVTVYPASADIVRGLFVFAQGRTQNELLSWTSISHPVLRLAPGAKALDRLLISAPIGTTGGERYSVVWAQVSASPANGGVTLVNRVGVRMYVSVGPGGGPPLSFTIGALTAHRSSSGEPSVKATVHNNGRRTIEIGGELSLSDGPDGVLAGPFAIRRGTVVTPGRSEPVAVHSLPIYRLDHGEPLFPLPVGPSTTLPLPRSSFPRQSRLVRRRSSPLSWSSPPSPSSHCWRSPLSGSSYPDGGSGGCSLIEQPGRCPRHRQPFNIRDGSFYAQSSRPPTAPSGVRLRRPASGQYLRRGTSGMANGQECT